jgi:hypothetical protein
LRPRDLRLPAVAALLAAVAWPVRAGLPSRPVERWRWQGQVEDPARPWPHVVVAAPMSDDDGDGDVDADDGADVVFLHMSTDGNSVEQSLSAVDGSTGSVLFHRTTPRMGSGFVLNQGGALALGDVDGDGVVEVLTSSNEVSLPAPEPAELIAFEHDGTPAWSAPWPGSVENDGQAIGLADLNQDGVPEAHLLGSVLSVDGSLAWSVTLAVPGTREYACFSLAADLDPGSPGLELLYGSRLFSSSGGLIWENRDVPMGATAIGDLDGDGDPEIPLIFERWLHVLDHAGVELAPRVDTGSPPPWGARPGAPLAADVDGDGSDEVVVSTSNRLSCYDWDGIALVQRWSLPIDDVSGASGPAAFDFDGDGAAEILYHDENAWFVIEGADGRVLHQEDFPCRTAMQSPIVVDTGGGCGATIVISGFGDWDSNDADAVDAVVAYDVVGAPTPRSVWNQRTYHVTNVGDAGSIPRVEPPPWAAGHGWLLQPGALGAVSSLAIDSGQVRDLSDCHLGLEVSWTPAVPDDPAAVVVYDVYRSDAAPAPDCADALSRPPVATGLTDTSWLDLDTEPDRSYVHAVRARLEPAGCQAPGTLCLDPVVELGDFPPEGVGATLRARHDAHEVTLSWADARALEAGEHFHLLKATDATAAFGQANAEADLGRTHVETDESAPLQFFDLRVASACEQVSADEYPPSY